MIAVLLLVAVMAGADQTSTAPPPKPEDSPLVKAAKASGGPHKPKSKVITNADVKKAGGTLLTLPPGAPLLPAEEKPKLGPIQQQDAKLRAEDAATKRVDDAQKKVAALEAESRRLEQAYYEENDPTVRDTVIADRFKQAMRQLDAARKELADAHDALLKLVDSSDK